MEKASKQFIKSCLTIKSFLSKVLRIERNIKENRMKFVLVDDLANKSVNHSFEIENSWAEIKWLKDK